MSVKGYLEVVDATLISGWAYDPSDPKRIVTVDIYDGDRFVARKNADEYRLNCEELGIGRFCGFSLRFAEYVFPLSMHVISVRSTEGGIDVENSPRVLKKEELQLDESFRELAIKKFEEYLSSSNILETNAAVSFLAGLIDKSIKHYEALKASPEKNIGKILGEGTALSILHSALSKYPKIDVPHFPKPEISIIIPVYNKFEYTYNCVRSIIDNIPTTSFEIIIADDVSSDETLFSSSVFSSSVRIVRHPENVGFLRSCNRSAVYARGNYLFFLNNDTTVKKGFLDELFYTFDLMPNVGIVGSKLVFPDGTLQECGGIIWRMGDGWNWGRGADPENPKFKYLREVDYVSGAALMISKSLFDEINGFDEFYAPAYYEDTDLCFRVRAAGKKVFVQPTSVICHYEGISSGTDLKSGVKKWQSINLGKFASRWKKTLSTHAYNGENPEREVERYIKKRALFIDDSVPTPDQDAGSNAATEHMLSLQRLGFHVVFLPGDNMARIEPYTTLLQRKGVECIYHPFFNSVEDYLRVTEKRFDLVYLHRHSNGSKYAGIARQHCGSAKIIYNVADLHFLRMSREAERLGDRTLARAAEEMKKSELGVMALVDGVIVHSDYEAEILSTELHSGDIFVVPWSIAPASRARPTADRSGIGFLGGFRHTPNVDAAIWLAKEIMPALRKYDKEPILCRIAGSNMPSEFRIAEADDIEMVGWVPSAKEFFSQLRLSIAPLRYGAGLKGKVLDSMSVGTPCIMTPIAAEGIHLPPELSDLVVNDTATIAEKVASIYFDELKI